MFLECFFKRKVKGNITPTLVIIIGKKRDSNPGGRGDLTHLSCSHKWNSQLPETAYQCELDFTEPLPSPCAFEAYDPHMKGT